jgi:hypothetical protein
MAYVTPLTAVSNATLTASQWNASVRDNFAETAPAKATTAGGLFVTTSLNTISERVPKTSFVGNNESTASTTYTNLTTTGPSVTVTSGQRAMVILSAMINVGSAGGQGFMVAVVSGATTIAANDDQSFRVQSDLVNSPLQASYVYYEEGLTSGSNVFTCQYRSGTAVTSIYDNRRLTVFPF